MHPSPNKSRWHRYAGVCKWYAQYGRIRLAPGQPQLWFTENGRDNMGNDIPADELNVAPRTGMHFGYPYCHQGNIPDPEFGKGHPCSDYTSPVQILGPHVAALGMRFYTSNAFPAVYHNQVFIAEHGSWNRPNQSDTA